MSAPEENSGGTSCAVGLASRLGFADLKDEALLSICLISAIAAVLTPIMILAGLKFGMIELMRVRFIQDPTFRLISPVEFKHREEDFFTRLRQRPDVLFVQPEFAGSGTAARIAMGAKTLRVDVLPTAPGDPILVENQATAPGPADAVVTQPIAEGLGLKAGDSVRLLFDRVKDGRREEQSLALKVVSVLPLSADDKARVYAVFDVPRDIERYKSGITVSSRDWVGLANTPDQSFDVVYLLLGEPMSEGDIIELRARAGFAEAPTITPEEFSKRTGLPAGDAQQIVTLVNSSRPASGQQITQLRQRLGERPFRLLPTASRLKVTLEKHAGAIEVRAADPKQFEVTVVDGALGRWPAWRDNLSYSQVERLSLPEALAKAQGIKIGDRVRLKVQPASKNDASQALTIDVFIDALGSGPAILAHPALVGMLLRSRVAPLAFDQRLGVLVPDDVPLRTFRAYGRAVDDMPGLVKALEAEGVPLRAKAQEIASLQALDTALTQMTLIIALVALIGGAAVLVASFYASIERKKGELSLLRLLGFPRAGVFAMPVMQSLMLAAAGFLLALLLFAGFARLINQYYSGSLPVRGDICRLAARHIAYFAATTFTIAMLASLFAARRALQIDPAEALRQE